MSTVGEILELKLNADWVVPSACNTGAASADGAGAVSGLGSALSCAGSRSLLVSNGPLETTSARHLTVALFRRQADDMSLIKAEALRKSMEARIDHMVLEGNDGRAVFGNAHPIFWAPFAIVGDGV